MKPLLFAVFAVFLISCSKEATDASLPGGFMLYRIDKGSHYADKSQYRDLEISSLRFRVLFDSTAIYSTSNPENQYDINKLLGFSDNSSHHHQFSARFGWRWSDDRLRLFAYVYNNGELTSREISEVNIGEAAECSIEITGETYTFRVNQSLIQIPRGSTAPVAKGYMLYPYFGGDEPAPHLINIWISVQND